MTFQPSRQRQNYLQPISRMSGPWPRNQTLSFKPGGTGSGAAGSLNSTVPDISIRNHKKWRTTFEKSISDHLGRGFDGAECVHRYTRRAINNVLDKEPRAETFKRFQVISDIIDSLTNGSFLLVHL